VSLIGGKREYEYRYRVGFKGQEAGPFIEGNNGEPYDQPKLNVSVPNPGKVNLAVLTGDVDYDTLVEQVQVRFYYEDTEWGVPREESMALLSAGHQEEHYQRTIFKPPRKPIYYRRRFRMENEDVYEDPEWISLETSMKTPSETPLEWSHQTLTINQPFVSKLEVAMLPTGEGWEDIDAVVIDLKYEDMRNDYTLEERLILKSKNEFKTWTVPLRNKDLRAFEYRWLASYKNGYVKDSGWQEGNTDEYRSVTCPILVERQGIKIRVLPYILDFAASPLTEVNLHYKAAGIDRQETFFFREKTEQTWSFAAPPNAPIEYTYQITHYPVGGDPVKLPPPSAPETDTVLVLMPYRASPAPS
jgi:hypothetical protein